MKPSFKINDEQILSVKVYENGERLVSLTNISRLYLPSQIKTYIGIIEDKDTVARKQIRERLIKVIDALPGGFGIVLFQSYRKYSYQKTLFQKQKAKLKKDSRILSDKELESAATEFVSNPDKFSPHVTGGAVDLGIVDPNKSLLDFGNTFQYDNKALMECKGLTTLQKSNRSMLKTVMESADFVNYPFEWWHWSYGDKYWGFIKNKPAFYDSV